MFPLSKRLSKCLVSTSSNSSLCPLLGHTAAVGHLRRRTDSCHDISTAPGAQHAMQACTAGCASQGLNTCPLKELKTRFQKHTFLMFLFPFLLLLVGPLVFLPFLSSSLRSPTLRACLACKTAPSSVLAPSTLSSKARSPVRSFLLLVAMPFAPSSFLAPSSDARSPVRSDALAPAAFCKRFPEPCFGTRRTRHVPPDCTAVLLKPNWIILHKALKPGTPSKQLASTGPNANTFKHFIWCNLFYHCSVYCSEEWKFLPQAALIDDALHLTKNTCMFLL